MRCRKYVKLYIKAFYKIINVFSYIVFAVIGGRYWILRDKDQHGGHFPVPRYGRKLPSWTKKDLLY